MEGLELGIDWVHGNEPTVVPTGDGYVCDHDGPHECAYWKLGENCHHTDCPECGREASAHLRAGAMLSTSGIVRLAREVVRIQEVYGLSIPDGHAVTVADLSRCRRSGAVMSEETRWRDRWCSLAWAEGVIDALCQNAWLQPPCYGGDPDERWSYMVGRILVELYLMRDWLRRAEARSFEVQP